MTAQKKKKEQEEDSVKSIPKFRKTSRIVEKDKMYWHYDKHAEVFRPISNFIIKNHVMIEGEEDSLRIVTIESTSQKTIPLIISYSAFTSRNSFISFVEKHGNFFYKGSDYELMEIKQKVFSDCKFIENAEKIGYNQKHDCFVLANGIIDEGRFHTPNDLGIVNGLYIAAAAEQNKNQIYYQNQNRYKFKNGSNLDLNSFIQLLTEVYDEYKTIIGVSFLISSMCFDQIGYKLSFFPMLNLSGQPGSGKTSFTRFLLAPFSSSPEVVMLSNVTATASMRKLEQASNIPVILDEFRNSLHASKLEALKNIYDLTGKTVGNKSNDSTTKQSRVLSPAIITGQEYPSGNEALLTRTINLGFAPVTHDSKKARLFNELTNEQEKGMGDILIELVKLRPLINQYFEIEYHNTIDMIQNVIQEFQNMGEKNFLPDTRLIKNYACILSPLIIAIKHGNLIILPQHSKEKVIERLVNKIVIKGIRPQALEEKANDEVNVFWEIFYVLVMEGKLTEDVDYQVDHTKRELWFYTTKVMGEYQKYGREIKGKDITDGKSIIKYFNSIDYYLGRAKKYYYKSSSAVGNKDQEKRSMGFRLDSLQELGVAL